MTLVKLSNDINPTLHRGGWIPPPLQFLVPGAFPSDLRGSKFWYNSCLILTMDVTNFKNLKGVPKKIWSMFFEAGVKNQKFKVDILVPKNIG